MKDFIIIEKCPICKTQLKHIEIEEEDVFGCPKCHKEIPYNESIKGNPLCYYCGKETQGAKIENLDDSDKPNETNVPICDECLIEQEYNPEDYK